MKVLLVWNGPANAEEGSILLRREIPLLRALRGADLELTVVLGGDAAGVRDALAAAGARVEVIAPLPPSASTLRALPRAIVALRRIVARVQPDLVEASEPMPAIAAGLAARGRTVIYRRQHAGGRLRVQLASRLAARLSRCTLVPSQAIHEISTRDDRPRRIELARTGTPEPRAVSRDELIALRRAIGIDESTRVVGVISRLRHEKGVDVAMRALALLGPMPDVTAIVVGNGPDEAMLRELANRVSIPLHFLGSRDDVEACYALADVVVIPSRRESFSRVALEAMAMGRPIVATRAGGLPEAVIDGETGLLVPPEDPTALAAALRALLADRALAQRFGRAARERYEQHFTVEAMAAARRAAWQRALESAVT
ncbi:MAG TPA: glycosyltransferase [Thermoanaerobaculia bacterium]